MNLHPSQAILNEYLEKHAAQHQAECSLRVTAKGRMSLLPSVREGAAAHVVLADFIDYEHDCRSTNGTLVIYMPEKRYERFKGKLIVESKCAEHLFFEVQIARKSNLSAPMETVIKEDHWKPVRRYHNLFIAEDQVMPFVQDYLFAERFTQRFLITSASKVLGAMSTQRLRSGAGQLLSFRQCALKE